MEFTTTSDTEASASALALTSGPLSEAPSSPLSVLSRSPTPPPPPDGQHSLIQRRKYPSPPSSQDSSHTASPCPETETIMDPAAAATAAAATAAAAANDGQPACKKRRIAAPNERTTAHLDLRADASIPDQQPQIDKLMTVLHKKRKIVVIAGAGISVAAGIPDFRSSTGLFKSLKSEHNLKSSGKDLFDASVYKHDDSTSTFHSMVRELSQKSKAAQPTEFHHLLATLAQQGRLYRLYTQNVDGIETSMPPLSTRVPLAKERGAWPKTIPLHGSLDHMECAKCHTISEFDAALFDGPVAPPCPHCKASDNVRTEHAGKRSHGIGCLRPRMVLYNEHNPDSEEIGSVSNADLRARPDALIVVGTTLSVPGVRRLAREMCQVVRGRRDGLTVWINLQSAPQDSKLQFDVVVRGPCDEVARRAALGKWDDPPPELVTQEEEQLRKARNDGDDVVVLLESPSKPRFTDQVPTPDASPRLPAKKTNALLKAEKTKQQQSTAPVTAPVQKLIIKFDSKAIDSTTAATTAAKPAPKKRGRKKKADANTVPINKTFKGSKAPVAASTTSKKATKENGESPIASLPKSQPVVPTKAELAQTEHKIPTLPMPHESSDSSKSGPRTPGRELSIVSPSDMRQNASLLPPVVFTAGAAQSAHPFAEILRGLDDYPHRKLPDSQPPESRPTTGNRERSSSFSVDLPAPPCSPITPPKPQRSRSLGMDGPWRSSPPVPVRSTGHSNKCSLGNGMQRETISAPSTPRGMEDLLD